MSDDAISKDLRPLHEAMQEGRYATKAWGRNVCEYAARELFELRAERVAAIEAFERGVVAASFFLEAEADKCSTKPARRVLLLQAQRLRNADRIMQLYEERKKK